MIEILTLGGIIVAVFVPILIKIERRLTRTETFLEILLTHNDIDPKESLKNKLTKGKRR
jgi:hypothetical protein